jgi:hypothetical protein
MPRMRTSANRLSRKFVLAAVAQSCCSPYSPHGPTPTLLSSMSVEVIAKALDAVSARDAKVFFKHCG